jgi:DNA polymerase (family 10)
VAPDESPDVPLLTNAELGAVFHEIGDLLEVKGELVFKTVAYHRAADAIERAPVEVARRYREGRPPEIAGVGRAIGDKLAELAATGRLAFLERLRTEVPASLIDVLRVPGIGPKTARLLWTAAGITSLDELRAAAAAGRLRGLRGLSARSEQLILEGIAGLERRDRRLLLDDADRIASSIADRLRSVPGVARVEIAGSLRRRRETIGDLDLLVETDTPEPVMAAFTSMDRVEAVIGTGPHKSSVSLRDGPQVDLMAMPPGEAGTYLVHFTGSRDHNVRLRARARDRGWSLSEKGFLRIGDDGEPLVGPAAELRTMSGEPEVYAFLGLDWVPPALREDRGEIEAALEHRLPRLVELADLQGDLHSHSDWSDGSHSIEAMAEAARRRGQAYQVLTDHSQSLAIARGLDPDRFRLQRAVVDRLNARYAAEEADGRAPAGTPAEGFRLLHGVELEIRADGRLDLDDQLLETFDVVVAALHVARRQSRRELTDRVIGAIRSRHVDVIAHPAGRMIGERDDLDLDWDAVFAAAVESGTALEVNGSPHRLDLTPDRARRALEAGCLLAVDSDAHRVEELGYVRWGIDQARRGWATRASVLNTRSRDELLAWVAGKPSRA